MLLTVIVFLGVVICAIVLIVLVIINTIWTLREGKKPPLPPVGRHIRLEPPKTRPWIAGRGDRQIRMKKD